MEFKSRKVYTPEIDAFMQKAVQLMPGNPANVSFWTHLKEKFPDLNDFSSDSLRSHWILIKTKQKQFKKKNKIRFPIMQNSESLINQQIKNPNIDSRVDEPKIINLKEDEKEKEKAALRFEESTNYESDKETEENKELVGAGNIVYEIGNVRGGGNMGIIEENKGNAVENKGKAAENKGNSGDNKGNAGGNKGNSGENERKQGLEGMEGEREGFSSSRKNDLLISEEKIRKSNEKVIEKQDVIDCFYDLVDLCSFFYGKKIQEKQVLDVLITMHGSVKKTLEYFKRDYN